MEPMQTDMEHKYDMGQRVVYMNQVWTVVGVQLSSALVMWYTLERPSVVASSGALRTRAFEDEIRAPD